MKNDDLRENKQNTATVKKYFEDGNTIRVYEEEVRGNAVKAEPNVVPYEVTGDIVTKARPEIGTIVDFFSAAVLAIAILVTLYMCINYLQIRADIVQLEKEISTLESDISEINKENNAMESALLATAVDYDYVFETATKELGMVFPTDNEVVFYVSEGGSYYRDYASVK